MTWALIILTWGAAAWFYFLGYEDGQAKEREKHDWKSMDELIAKVATRRD